MVADREEEGQSNYLPAVVAALGVPLAELVGNAALSALGRSSRALAHDSFHNNSNGCLLPLDMEMRVPFPTGGCELPLVVILCGMEWGYGGAGRAGQSGLDKKRWSGRWLLGAPPELPFALRGPGGLLVH